jgi:hypothetical protein
MQQVQICVVLPSDLQRIRKRVLGALGEIGRMENGLNIKHDGEW